MISVSAGLPDSSCTESSSHIRPCFHRAHFFMHRLVRLFRNEPAVIKSSSIAIRASSHHSLIALTEQANHPKCYKILQPSRLSSKAEKHPEIANPTVIVGISARISKCTAHLEGMEEAHQPHLITRSYSRCMSAPYRTATSVFSGFYGSTRERMKPLSSHDINSLNQKS